MSHFLTTFLNNGIEINLDFYHEDLRKVLLLTAELIVYIMHRIKRESSNESSYVNISAFFSLHIYNRRSSILDIVIIAHV